MKELKEYRKEIFRRSHERIRKLKRFRLIALSTSLAICLFLLLSVLVFKDWNQPEPADEGVQFTAQVIEYTDNWVLVEPLEGEAERSSADKISFGTQNLDSLDIQVGTKVVITYGGEIMESYPAQIIPISWRLA